MLDGNLRISTLDHVIICEEEQAIGAIGECDSKIGIYTIDFKLNPYMLNSGSYKAEIYFGESMSYLIFDGFSQLFAVEDSCSDRGGTSNATKGYIRPINNIFPCTWSPE
jgi:hypothetical protein